MDSYDVSSKPKKSLKESIPLTSDVLQTLGSSGYIDNDNRAKYSWGTAEQGDLITYSHQLPPNLELYKIDFEDLSPLRHVQYLTLTCCKLINDLSPFRGGSIVKLVLYRCKAVTDVSALSDINNVSLYGCTGVTDVSSLQGVSVLSLDLCTSITDITALGKSKSLRMLSLTDCTGITDISSLGESSTITYLCLNGCTGIVDVSALVRCKTLNKLDMTRCLVEDVNVLGGCQSLVELDISNCYRVVDISSLRGGNIKTLCTKWCTGLQRKHT